ncbi:unnamed protein product [Rangifer tarandus platyrhynchus]|uniref:Uncharacterized protein n=2 Tax=Rangifer tarandus platyrhynchus TaxID=3082113 RepID=A0AC59Y5H5_RANTA|nr:unnamed protein product [Rangifer tarandus platyrhynchus]
MNEKMPVIWKLFLKHGNTPTSQARSVFCQFFVSCQDSCEPVIISSVMRITSPGPTSAPGPGSHSFPEGEIEAAGKDQGVPGYPPRPTSETPHLLWKLPSLVVSRGSAAERPGPGELGHAGLAQGVITDVHAAFSLPAVPSWTPESAQEALLSLGRWIKEAAWVFRSTHPSGQHPARLVSST